MTPGMKIGLLEIMLNGKKRILKFQEKENHWEYTRGEIKIIKNCEPEKIAGLLVHEYGKKGIEINPKITYITNHTQNEKMVPEEILESV